MTGPRRSTDSVSRRWGLTALAAWLLLVGSAFAQPADCPPVGKIRPAVAPPPAAFPLAPETTPPPQPSSPKPRGGSQSGRLPLSAQGRGLGGGGSSLPVPVVAVRVRVPSVIDKDRELTYHIVAENTSRAFAHHVAVRVNIPASSATFVRATPEPDEQSPAYIWKIGSLAPQARRQIMLVVKPTGIEEVACCARVQFEHGQCVRTRIGKGDKAAPATPRPALEVRLNAPAEAVRYDIFTCKVEVRNNGRSPARKVVLRDTLPKELSFLNSKPATKGDGPLVWDLGEIPPGGSRTIEYQVVAKELGRLTSNIVVEAEGGLQHSTSHTVQVGQPALTVVKTGPVHRAVGRNATYQITVSNPGNLAATGVQISDELPAEIEFVGATSGGQVAAGHVRWNIGTLAPGAKQTVKVVVRAKRAGTFKNVCTVTADRGLTEQSKVETKFEDVAGLQVELDKDRDPIAVNQEANVTLRVRNAGNAAETNLDVRISVPEGVKVLEVRGPDRTEKKGAEIHLPPLARLAAGEERGVILRLRAEKAGAIKVGVMVVADSTGPDRAIKMEETLTVQPRSESTSRKPGVRW